MSKPPSLATQLRNAKRELAALEKHHANVRRDRDFYHAACRRAEAEVVEWRTRFDALLARVPKTEPLP